MTDDTAPRRPSRLRRVAASVWAVLFTAGLAWLAVTFGDLNREMFRSISPLMVLQNVPAVLLAFALTQMLMRKRVFRWRPSDLFIRRSGNGAAAQVNGSLLLVAMRAPLVGIATMALLVFDLPTIAMLEEFIFRQGTTDWKSMLLRSALFGLAHFGTDLPLGSAVSISVVGLWFSHWYFLGGIGLSGQAHFSYLLIIFSLAVPALLYGRLKSLFRAPRQ